jgi:hypothetical protein
MIPQRMFGSELPQSGLRDRVTACRKRVRESRTIAAAARTLVSERSLERARLENVASGSVEAGNGVALRIEGQEVGIT